MKRYIHVWWLLTLATSQISFQSRFGAALFLVGKVMRYVFFLLFLLLLSSKTQLIAGYTFWQMALFYATFNVLDTLPQFFFRNVYRFRQQILSGYFDNLLTKPLPALFHPLFGGSDVLDIPILIISFFFIPYAASHIDGLSVAHIGMYLLLLLNGFFIALGFHIFVLGIGILTTAVDNTIMLYRDLTQMGRLPIDIYQEPLRSLLTFVVPVGIMITYPSKALMGLLSWEAVMIAFLFGGTLVLISVHFWKYALRSYTSASN